MWPDIINGGLELFGAPFILLSVIKLYKEKKVRGISWIHVSYFTAWGYWNLFYYPNLGQWASLFGTLGVTALNTIWLCQLIHYSRKPDAVEKA